MHKINNLLHRNRDANHNGIPDSQERGVAYNDRNMNGIPDNQERQGPVDKVKNLLHLNRDANHNGIPDSQERRTFNDDRNMNGIPDNLERRSNFSNDRNMNGIPDNLERNTIITPGSLATTTTTTLPPQFLERRNAMHTQLLGRNRAWNLRTVQTRSYLPMDYYRMETSFEREFAQSGKSSETFLRQEPINLQRVEKEVVVHEHLHPVEKEEIQPVIFREREQLDIKQITQQLHETQIQPTLIQQRELAAEVRAPIVERSAPIQENIVLPSVDRDATMRSVQMNAPIVNETIKKTVVEEIQPVLERDIIAPTLLQETLPIYEKIVEAPHVYREVLPTRELGSRSLGAGEILTTERTFAAPVATLPLQTVQPVSVTTTTTTTDSFVPAKLVKGEVRNATTGSPLGSRVL